MSIWQTLISDYVTFLRAAGRRDLTIRQHRHYLRQLQKGAPNPLMVDRAVLLGVIGRAGWSPETRKSARSVYRSFGRWLVAEGKIEHSPAEDLPAVHIPAAVARPTPDRVYSKCLAQSPERVQLMLRLGAHAGLRAGEIALVNSSDLGADNVLVVHGKGGKVRRVPIADSELVTAIRRTNGWLFPGRKDGHLSAGYVSKLVARQMPDHWTAHTLRHRVGTVMLKRMIC